MYRIRHSIHYFVNLMRLINFLDTSMNDETTCTGFDEMDATDNSLMRTYTQVVSCAVGDDFVERRRQSLRAKLEREQYERDQELENSFTSTFRNLLKGF